jgi:hypothetical protein
VLDGHFGVIRFSSGLEDLCKASSSQRLQVLVLRIDWLKTNEEFLLL